MNVFSPNPPFAPSQVRAASSLAFGDDKCAGLFAPGTFARFRRDARGRIAIKPFFDFVLRRNLLQQVRSRNTLKWRPHLR